MADNKSDMQSGYRMVEEQQGDDGIILPKAWKNYFDSLRSKNASMRGERDFARRWAAAWKRAAKEYRAECKVTDDLLRRAQREYSDAARAQLANAAASEVEAVQGRQECERELREARFAARRLLLDREVALSQRDNARAAIVELADYLERVADNDIVDANELREFVAETKRMYGQEDADG